MNYVEPIREPAVVENIAKYLKKTNVRNYILFMCGIYTGLRISDILTLRVKDVKNKKYIALREIKTKKQKLIEINPVLKKELTSYIADKNLNEYLIKSRQGNNKPITRTMAYIILRDVAELFSLEAIGTHTLRKTFGYHFYRQYKNGKYLQLFFNHKYEHITLRYIGIQQESINKAVKDFRIY